MIRKKGEIENVAYGAAKYLLTRIQIVRCEGFPILFTKWETHSDTQIQSEKIQNEAYFYWKSVRN